MSSFQVSYITDLSNDGLRLDDGMTRNGEAESLKWKNYHLKITVNITCQVLK